jgi:6-phosphofructokinase 2
MTGSVDMSGPRLAGAIRAGAHLVKPNLQQLAELTGRPPEREADWLAARTGLVETGGAEVVALTLGAVDALLGSCDCRLFTPPIPVRPAVAVGAGDSFLGDLVRKLHASGDPCEAFRYGVAAGTTGLLTPVSEPCRPDDLDRVRLDVRLQDVRARELT